MFSSLDLHSSVEKPKGLLLLFSCVRLYIMYQFTCKSKDSVCIEIMNLKFMLSIRSYEEGSTLQGYVQLSHRDHHFCLLATKFIFRNNFTCLTEIIVFLFQRSKRSFDNFDPEFTQEAARLTPIDRNFIQNIDHRVFDGFSYVNPVLNSAH